MLASYLPAFYLYLAGAACLVAALLALAARPVRRDPVVAAVA